MTFMAKYALQSKALQPAKEQRLRGWIAAVADQARVQLHRFPSRHQLGAASPGRIPDSCTRSQASTRLPKTSHDTRQEEENDKTKLKVVTHQNSSKSRQLASRWPRGYRVHRERYPRRLLEDKRTVTPGTEGVVLDLPHSALSLIPLLVQRRGCSRCHDNNRSASYSSARNLSFGTVHLVWRVDGLEKPRDRKRIIKTRWLIPLILFVI